MRNESRRQEEDLIIKDPGLPKQGQAQDLSIGAGEPLPASRASLFGAGMIAISSLILLASVVTLPGIAQRSILGCVFLLTGVMLRRNTYSSYLFFLALYPVIPSHLSQLGLREFAASDFLFVCFAFWWALYKIVDSKPPFVNSPLRPLLFCQFIFLCASAFFGLYTTKFLASSVFLVQLKDHWNLFLQSNASTGFGTIRALLTLSEGLLFLFITLDVIESSKKLDRAVEIIFYSATVVSFVGLIQYFFHFRLLGFWIRENPNLPRINSTLDDPNSLGTYLAAALGLGIYSISFSSPRKFRWNLLALLMIFANLFLSGSRSALGAAFLLLFLLPLVLKRTGYGGADRRLHLHAWIARVSVLAAIVLFLLIGIASWVNYSAEKPANLTQFLLTSLNFSQPASTILKGRDYLWQTALRVFREFPVFGAGVGTFLYRVSSRPYDYPEMRVPENAHNYFLQILAEEGLFGLLLFVSILWMLFSPVLIQLRKKAGEEENLPLFGYLGALLAVLLTSLTGHPLLLPKIQYFFWGLAAFVLIRTGALSQPGSPRLRPFLIVITAIFLVGFPIHFLLAQRLPGSSSAEIGYYEWERDATGNLFRWTKGESVSDLPVQGNVISFKVRRTNTSVQQKPCSVDIYINDLLRERIVLNGSNWTPLRYKLDPQDNHRRILVRIRPSVVFAPFEFAKRDVRTLGVQVTPFQWECPPNYSSPSTTGTVRTVRQTFRVSSVVLEQYRDPNKLEVLDTSHIAIRYRPELAALLTQGSDSIALYSPPPGSFYTVDASHNLVLRNSIEGKNVLIRIHAMAAPRDAEIPVLYVRRDGQQMLKLPVFRREWTSYYFFVQGDFHELAFFGWDGLSPISRRFEIPVLIGEVRAWTLEKMGESIAQKGWFETASYQLFYDSNFPTPVALKTDGQSVDVAGQWHPGIYSLLVSAKASLAGDTAPVLGIYIADRKVGALTIGSEMIQDYRTSLELEGDERIRIVFENDYYNAATGEDRNVFVNRVRVEQNPSIVIFTPVSDLLNDDETCVLLKKNEQ